MTFVGDSVTFSQGVNDDETWPSLVAAQLHLDAANDGRSSYNIDNLAPLIEHTDGCIVWLTIINDTDAPFAYAAPHSAFHLYLEWYGFSAFTRRAPYNTDLAGKDAIYDTIADRPDTLILAFDDGSYGDIMRDRYGAVLIPRFTHGLSRIDGHANAAGNATHFWRLNGTSVMLLKFGVLQPNFSGGLGLGSSSFPWGASYINSINGGTLSGNNSGDVTLTGFGSSPNSRGLSLSGQTLNMQPANASNPGGIAASGSQTIGAQLQLPVGSTVAQASWIAATYQNSFTTFNASWFAAAYYKDSNGTVWIRGHVSRASAALNTAIFTLPAGYRPSKNVEFATDANDKFARLSVSSSGVVTIQAADSATWYSNFSVQCSFDTRS